MQQAGRRSLSPCRKAAKNRAHGRVGQGQRKPDPDLHGHETEQHATLHLFRELPLKPVENWICSRPARISCSGAIKGSCD